MNARASLPATNRSTPRLDSAMVLAALPVPAVVLNAEDRFTFANGAAEQFFRLSAGALCQLKLSDILPPDNRVFAV
ncbi:MAG: PAS domain-containing protein, partial [Alphaproteobacteria bacterium]